MKTKLKFLYCLGFRETKRVGFLFVCLFVFSYVCFCFVYLLFVLFLFVLVTYALVDFIQVNLLYYSLKQFYENDFGNQSKL
jgi:hypothetical protein